MAERNALAELFEQLDGCSREDDDFWDAVAKSKRIIAELAKVNDPDYADVAGLRLIVKNCRAIAAEGADKR